MFYLAMESEGALGTMLDSLEIAIGRPPVLIVDDDGGANVEGSYRRALDDMAVLYDIWDVSAGGKIDAEELIKYDVAVWLTGAESESTLTQTDQDHLAAFLDAGHHLLLSGQNIGDEVGGSSFFPDHLHVTHLADTVSLDPPYLDGAPGDVIAAGDSLMLSGSEPQHSPSGLEAINGGIAVYTYRSAPQYAAASRYESPQGYKVVYLAFGYEGIRGTTEYTHGPVLMRRILEWFDVETTVADDPAAGGRPRGYALSQNYPNPFNAETSIEYTLPQGIARRGVTLRIYNLLGQEVRTLVDGSPGPGVHRVRWDGRDRYGRQAATGVYFYRLESGTFAQTHKMVLLR
jgi:hypothetical protein